MGEQSNLTTLSRVTERVVAILVVVWCAVKQIQAESEDLLALRPLASEKQLTYLAEDMCDTLFTNEAQCLNCIKNFGSPNRVSLSPSKLQVVCRTQDEAKFALTPASSHWQAVALVPDDKKMFINWNVMRATKKLYSISIDSNNSVFWIAAMNNDWSPGRWRRGPTMPVWNGYQSYEMGIEDPRFDYNGNSELNATFKVTFSGEMYPCTIKVENTCNKNNKNFFIDPIKMEYWNESGNPDENNIEVILDVKVPNVPLGDDCELSLWSDGVQLKNKFYHSSSSEFRDEIKIEERLKQDLQMREALAEPVKDLNLETEAMNSGWNIEVKWSPLKHEPDKFNLTLQSKNIMQSVEVAGNATQFTFTNVSGRRLVEYNVSVTTITPDGRATTSQWGQFPNPEIVQNVTLEAEASGAGWDIHVQWLAPQHYPTRYNLTLLAPGVRRIVFLPGRATAYTFKDVAGEDMGLYNVSVVAMQPNGLAFTSRRALFPVRPAPNYQAVIVTGSWSGALALAAAAAGGAVCWRRRRARQFRHLYFQGPELKLPKECILEPCPEPGVEDSWEVRPERLLLHEVVGEGAFGVVRRGTLAPGGREVAVKMLKDFPTVEEIRSFRAETELMKSVGAHPHVVSLLGCCSGRRPLIVAEYCSRGDLLNFLRCSWDVMVSKRNAKYYNNNMESSEYRNDLFKNHNMKDNSKLTPLVVNKLYDLQGICDSELTPLDLLSFCRQIAMGMEFLASNRVVHRDLAARNILVTGDRTLKIADFGLSRDVYQENQYKQKGNGKMPVKWMALESLTHRIYTTQSDVWSFGVVVWEVVTVGGAPYAGVAPARLPRLLRAGYRMPRPNNCTATLYEVMMSCWRARPRDRPTFAELHSALDALLGGACADRYLSLELDDEPPPEPRPQRYIKMMFRGGNRVWARGESYERPLKAPLSNHYTTAPAPLAKPQIV